jgi:hypothetical protein
MGGDALFACCGGAVNRCRMVAKTKRREGVMVRLWRCWGYRERYGAKYSFFREIITGQ